MEKLNSLVEIYIFKNLSNSSLIVLSSAYKSPLRLSFWDPSPSVSWLWIFFPLGYSSFIAHVILPCIICEHMHLCSTFPTTTFNAFYLLRVDPKSCLIVYLEPTCVLCDRELIYAHWILIIWLTYPSETPMR